MAEVPLYREFAWVFI
jgi:hypothetical protein